MGIEGVAVSRSLELEVPVNWGDGERIIIVDDYSYSRARKACLFRAPEDCYPAEPATIEYIECHWQDTGVDLSQENWDAFGEKIEEVCFQHVENEADAAEADAGDRAYERWKDRSLETI